MRAPCAEDACGKQRRGKGGIVNERLPLEIADLDTPSLLVDLDRMQANIDRMAAITREAGVDLRPHAKTHKTPQIGYLQIAAGSPGLTVAKLGEAEVFADAGIDNLFIAYPQWGEIKWERLCQLARRAQVRVAADSYELLEGLSRVAARHGQRILVRLEVDSGFGRTGLQSAEEVRTLARRMESLPGVELVGLMGYGGQAGKQPDAESIRQVARAEGEGLVEIATMLRADGFAVPELSAGGTPSGPYVAAVPGITEIRPGTYVFSDRSQATTGWGDLDGCALTVLVTVVSRPTPTRAIVDGGSKTFSSDRAPHSEGFGAVRGHPDIEFSWLTEEHGMLTVPPDADLPIGTRLQVIPNHVCAAVNLHDRLVAVRGERVEAVWPIAARGRVQ
jgi:D-serine deaminase-like pyridoxal phosphate-dependent protein